jgi:hypothetical protein
VGCALTNLPAAQMTCDLQLASFAAVENVPALQSLQPRSVYRPGLAMMYFPAAQLLQPQLL